VLFFSIDKFFFLLPACLPASLFPFRISALTCRPLTFDSHRKVPSQARRVARWVGKIPVRIFPTQTVSPREVVWRLRQSRACEGTVSALVLLKEALFNFQSGHCGGWQKAV